MTSKSIVQKLRNCCNILRDDGLLYQDYIEQLTGRPAQGIDIARQGGTWCGGGQKSPGCVSRPHSPPEPTPPRSAGPA